MYKDLVTVRVSIHPMLRFISKANKYNFAKIISFNTSNVKVHPLPPCAPTPPTPRFNTSNVKVHPLELHPSL